MSRKYIRGVLAAFFAMLYGCGNVATKDDASANEFVLASLTNDCQLGVVLGGEKNRLLMLDGKLKTFADGELTNTNGHTKKVTLTFSELPLSVSSHPYYYSDREGFSWAELNSLKGLSIKDTSTNRFYETPQYIGQQGRSLSERFGENFNWPQVHVVNNSGGGWASLHDGTFTLKQDSSMRPKVCGLVQAPFLTLLPNKLLDNRQVSGEIIDFTYTNPPLVLVKNRSWMAEQAVIPRAAVQSDISSVVLFASLENCSVFVTTWTNGKTSAFGYCAEGSGGPTPLISGFKSLANGNLVLQVVEVTGDEENHISIIIENDVTSEKLFKYVEVGLINR